MRLLNDMQTESVPEPSNLLALQARRIEQQKIELSRLSAIHARDARQATIRSAIGFLLTVIFRKIYDPRQ